MLVLAAALAALAPAGAAAATVEVMVVGRERVLREPRVVTLKSARVPVAGRRCTVAGRTPLAVLARTGLRLRLRDYGSCGRSPRDATGLYVRQVAGDRAAGRRGWVYKVGNRVGTAPAGDPAGPFGNGGLRTGQRLLWFWCVLGAGGSCQRTLEALPARDAAAPGEALAVTVRGYDDNGRGIAVEGATVRLGTASAVTDAAGRATLTVPAAAGPVPLEAEKPGLVRALPREVTIG